MKYLVSIIILFFLISCKHHPKDKLKFVNDQNDGWNAFSITLRDDNTYKRQDFGSSNMGTYSISGNIISLGKEKIIFNRTAKGCLYNVKYISKDHPSDLRVVFDSLLCDHIPPEKLIGSWKFENSSFTLDTLQLNENGIAKFRKEVYNKWDFHNSALFLSKNGISTEWLVLNLKQDTLSLAPCFIKPTDTAYSIKGVRLK